MIRNVKCVLKKIQMFSKHTGQNYCVINSANMRIKTHYKAKNTKMDGYFINCGLMI